MESPGAEKYLRVKEVAGQMSLSPQTIRRIFEDRPGVKIYGDRSGSKSKRRYRTLMIPESVLETVKKELE